MDISRITKNRFGYQEILGLEPDMPYERLSQVISGLCEEGKILPVKNSGKTSFSPSVYREYKKVSPKTDYSSCLPEISALHPRLSISRYMGRPGEFADNREQILLLSEFLWRQGGQEPEMSIKERSYDIWRDEKFLESKAGRKILSFNGLDERALNCYYAPEPFFCTRIAREGMVLVIENKDPWYSIGKALKTLGTGTFCGCPISLLVYGEGNKASRDGALAKFIRDEGLGSGMGRDPNQGPNQDPDQGPHQGPYQVTDVCYAGDIDCAGIDILYGVIRHNPDIAVEPFVPLYEAMARRAAGQLEAGCPLEESKDERNLAWNREFLRLFDGGGQSGERDVVERALEENRLIPQEILSYPDYEVMCGMEGKEPNV